MSRPGTRFADECAGHSAKHRLVKHSFEQVNTAWIVCTCKYWPAAGHNMPLQGHCDANSVGTAVRVGQDQWLTKAAQCSMYESPRVWSALLSAAGSISGISKVDFVKTLSSLLRSKWNEFLAMCDHSLPADPPVQNRLQFVSHESGVPRVANVKVRPVSALEVWCAGIMSDADNSRADAAHTCSCVSSADCKIPK